MTKILLAYYSRTGTTRILAEFIASLFPCDIEAIKDLHDRQGIVGTVRSGWQGWLRRPAPIKNVTHLVLDYDLGSRDAGLGRQSGGAGTPIPHGQSNTLQSGCILLQFGRIWW